MIQIWSTTHHHHHHHQNWISYDHHDAPNAMHDPDSMHMGPHTIPSSSPLIPHHNLHYIAPKNKYLVIKIIPCSSLKTSIGDTWVRVHYWHTIMKLVMIIIIQTYIPFLWERGRAQFCPLLSFAQSHPSPRAVDSV